MLDTCFVMNSSKLSELIQMPYVKHRAFAGNDFQRWHNVESDKCFLLQLNFGLSVRGSSLDVRILRLNIRF